VILSFEMVVIRREKPEDIRQIFSVNEQAFETPTEAGIVDVIRENCFDTLSLVAEDEGEIVGHIFFSPAEIEWSGTVIKGMGLAPMAVRPDRQRQGIGSRLVRAGLEILKEEGCSYVIVVGHPGFYPKFGFEPASKYHLECQWEGVPDEAFMIVVNDPSSLLGVKGIARYRDEFDEAMVVEENRV
jgi:putative acetyltransferase